MSVLGGLRGLRELIPDPDVVINKATNAVKDEIRSGLPAVPILVGVALLILLALGVLGYAM